MPHPNHPPGLQDQNMIEKRLEDLESKISYQEDQIDELNKTIYQQQQKLDRLEAICGSLARHIQSMAEPGNAGMAANERPPHY